MSVGRSAIAGIATRYGLDGPGIQFRCERDFPHSSRSSLESTQPSVHTVGTDWVIFVGKETGAWH